ncbi:MAG: hypothetical protein IKP77_03210 [Acholeplasmatales bacterium]|nr:hypothetical protein [Acholeplasmatales bacterium]
MINMKLLLIYNPFSGKGKNKKVNELIKLLENKFEITEFVSNGIGSITDYLKNDNNIYDIITICGGDGTINEAISSISEFNYSPKIAVVPLGTMNDFSHYLGMSKNIKKTVNYIINMKTISHDIYKANDKIFVYGFALGMLTNISYKKFKFKKIFGRLSYYLVAIKEIFKAKKIKLEADIDNKKIDMKSNLVLISSTNRVAGYKIKKGNDLVVAIFKGGRFLLPFKLYWYLITGHTKYKYDVNNLVINTDGSSFNTDGEYNKEVNKIKIEKYKTFDFITK